MKSYAAGSLDRPGNAALDEWVARRVAAGWRPKAIVAACDGAISLRTAYRWCKAVIRVEDVRLGGFVAPYAIRRGQPPIRLAPWKKA
jgi:hypothetical protein